jgi:hypothetical protein
MFRKNSTEYVENKFLPKHSQATVKLKDSATHNTTINVAVTTPEAG